MYGRSDWAHPGLIAADSRANHGGRQEYEQLTASSVCSGQERHAAASLHSWPVHVRRWRRPHSRLLLSSLLLFVLGCAVVCRLVLLDQLQEGLGLPSLTGVATVNSRCGGHVRLCPQRCNRDARGALPLFFGILTVTSFAMVWRATSLRCDA